MPKTIVSREFAPKSLGSPKTYENHWTRSRRDSQTNTKKNCFYTLVCCRRVPNDVSKVHLEPGSGEIYLNCDRELSSRLPLWPSRRCVLVLFTLVGKLIRSLPITITSSSVCCSFICLFCSEKASKERRETKGTTKKPVSVSSSDEHAQ